MSDFSVWDAVNCTEEEAEYIFEDDAKSAAIAYAEQDVDGGIDGIYTNEKGLPLNDLNKEGQPIFVRDSNDVLTRWRVGVVEFEPVYAASQEELEPDDGRCPHGAFFTGAGACPQCGRGAD
jgi:hypothetical protein